MEQKSKILITVGLTLTGLGLLLVASAFSFRGVRLIACDVGQGDGLLLISPSGKQILVDGGPGSKIIGCLSQNMPFWDRTIEAVFLTHPQKDHLEGLLTVIERYKVQMVATTGIRGETELFSEWEKAVKTEGAKVYLARAGDRLVVDDLNLEVLWPASDQLTIWQKSPPEDLNESSVVLRVNYGQFCAYLTGDIPKELLEPLINRSCQVLKISHHGSKTGTNQQIVDLAKPQIAIIQVGRNNYGHPHKEVLNLLQSKGIKVLRNDTNGIIEIQSNGSNLHFDRQKE